MGGLRKRLRTTYGGKGGGDIGKGGGAAPDKGKGGGSPPDKGKGGGSALDRQSRGQKRTAEGWGSQRAPRLPKNITKGTQKATKRLPAWRPPKWERRKAPTRSAASGWYIEAPLFDWK